MPDLTDINIKRIMDFLEEIRNQMKAIELFIIIAPVTLHVLESIEPTEDFAEEHGNYLRALQKEVANPLAEILKGHLERVEKIYLEKPDAVPMAFSVLSESGILPTTFIYYDELIRGRTRILNRAKTESKRKALPVPKLISVPDKSKSKPQEISNVKKIKTKRMQADFENLKKATNKYGFYSKTMIGDLDIASRTSGLSQLVPELSFLAQDMTEARDSIMVEMKNYLKFVEDTLDGIES